jgi:hypothetical protein
MSDARFRLLGTYTPPAIRIGDTAYCRYRRCRVVFTSVSSAPIPWPRCRRLGSGGFGSGLWVNKDLVRAIRTESAEALKHHFDVSTTTVWQWRRRFNVKQWGTPGSRSLLDAITLKANEAVRGKKLSEKAKQERRERALKMNLIGYAHAARAERAASRTWSAAELTLLGTMPDTRLALRLGRTPDEVKRERGRRGIPRYRKPEPPEASLTPEEREQLRRDRIAAAKRRYWQDRRATP